METQLLAPPVVGHAEAIVAAALLSALMDDTDPADTVVEVLDDAEQAARAIDNEVRERVRRSGRCNVSRAVSDLVRAGLVRRHYQGYRVDHHNRGAQREAVYTITEAAARALWSQRA